MRKYVLSASCSNKKPQILSLSSSPKAKKIMSLFLNECNLTLCYENIMSTKKEKLCISLQYLE